MDEVKTETIDITKRQPVYVEALRDLVPQSQETLLRISNKGEIWSRQPKPYEESLVAAFCAVVERDEGKTLSAGDVLHTAALLGWIEKSEPEKTKREVLLNSASKSLIGIQKENLSDPGFLEQGGWQKKLLACYRAHVKKLFESGTVKFADGIQTPVEGLAGVPRPLTPVERLTLFENQLRRGVKKAQ